MRKDSPNGRCGTGGLHLPRDIVPLRQVTRVVPVILEDVGRTSCAGRGTLWRVAGIARQANLTQELEALKARRLPIAILWGSSDRVIPDRAFRELCAAAGVGGAGATCVTVDGKHGWLLADPRGLAEVMTHVVGVAARAARLEDGPDEGARG